MIWSVPIGNYRWIFCAKKYLDTINVFEYKNEDDYMKEIKERCENIILIGEIRNDSNKFLLYLLMIIIYLKEFLYIK